MGLFDRLFRRRTSNSPTSAPAPASGDLRWVSGRLLFTADPYMLPKDITESNRLDFQHFMLKYALGGRNFLAPIGQPQAVLDVGCGTGRWAAELARQFPDANVIGVDLTAPATDARAATADQRPENYVFTAGNVIQGLPFADQSFDFVHMRLLYSAIPAASWPAVVAELARVTRRGGWVELVEAASLENRGPAVDLMNTWVVEACQRRGLDMTIGVTIGQLLDSVGLAGVTFRELSLPVGHSGGRLGTMLEADIVAILRAVKPLVVGQGITTDAAFDAQLVEWQAEVAQRPMTFPFYIAYGQRD